MENEADYAARPLREKEKLKKAAMEQITQARAELDAERNRLRKLAND